MQHSKKNMVVLFALVRCLRHFNKKFADQPLEVSVSKIEFIRLLQETGTIEKSARGLYLNLEMLEKSKLIAYENRFLKLTAKGLKRALAVEKEIAPYFAVTEKIGEFQMKQPLQAHFK